MDLFETFKQVLEEEHIPFDESLDRPIPVPERNLDDILRRLTHTFRPVDLEISPILDLIVETNDEQATDLISLCAVLLGARMACLIGGTKNKELVESLFDISRLARFVAIVDEFFIVRNEFFKEENAADIMRALEGDDKERRESAIGVLLGMTYISKDWGSQYESRILFEMYCHIDGRIGTDIQIFSEVATYYSPQEFRTLMVVFTRKTALWTQLFNDKFSLDPRFSFYGKISRLSSQVSPREVYTAIANNYRVSESVLRYFYLEKLLSFRHKWPSEEGLKRCVLYAVHYLHRHFEAIFQLKFEGFEGDTPEEVQLRALCDCISKVVTRS